MNTKAFKAAIFLMSWIWVALAAAQAHTPGAAAGSQLLERTLQIGGLERQFLLYVPASAAPGKPLLMVLHGSMSTPSEMRGAAMRTFERLSDQQGFVIAYPVGFSRSWHDCRKETSPPARTAKVDDVAFLRAVVKHAVAQFGSDSSKLYVFGFSAGGQMAYRLAWESPGDVAAIAAVGASLAPPEALDCVQPAKLPRIMLVNGTADAVNPYAGGPHMAGGTVLSAPDSARTLAAAHGLSGEGTDEPVSGPSGRDAADIRVLTWKGGSVPVVSLYTVLKGGHAVPSPFFSDFDAQLEAWKFFTAQ